MSVYCNRSFDSRPVVAAQDEVEPSNPHGEPEALCASVSNHACGSNLTIGEVNP